MFRKSASGIALYKLYFSYRTIIADIFANCKQITVYFQIFALKKLAGKIAPRAFGYFRLLFAEQNLFRVFAENRVGILPVRFSYSKVCFVHIIFSVIMHVAPDKVNEFML